MAQSYTKQLIFGWLRMVHRKVTPCFFLILMRQIGKQIRIWYNFVHYFRHIVGWQGWQAPPQKQWKLVSLVSPNKLAPIKGLTENGDKWHFYILFFFMTYRAKIYKRLIIRGRHPNWRVVAPMHKKRWKVGVTDTSILFCNVLFLLSNPAKSWEHQSSSVKVC